MALHVIRDDKGRMEKILDDKEYDSYQSRKGCLQFLLAAGFVVMIIYGHNTQEHEESSEAQTEAVAYEMVDIEPEETIEMKEEETASEEEDFDEDVTPESEDTTSVIDEDELVRRFLEKQ